MSCIVELVSLVAMRSELNSHRKRFKKRNAEMGDPTFWWNRKKMLIMLPLSSSSMIHHHLLMVTPSNKKRCWWINDGWNWSSTKHFAIHKILMVFKCENKPCMHSQYVRLIQFGITRSRELDVLRKGAEHFELIIWSIASDISAVHRRFLSTLIND